MNTVTVTVIVFIPLKLEHVSPQYKHKLYCILLGTDVTDQCKVVQNYDVEIK